jgi:hypothetical protein
MNRRAFVTGLGAVLAASLAAEAQQAPRRIGFIATAPPTPWGPPGRIEMIAANRHKKGRVMENDPKYISALSLAKEHLTQAFEAFRRDPRILCPELHGTVPKAQALELLRSALALHSYAFIVRPEPCPPSGRALRSGQPGGRSNGPPRVRHWPRSRARAPLAAAAEQAQMYRIGILATANPGPPFSIRPSSND